MHLCISGLTRCLSVCCFSINKLLQDPSSCLELRDTSVKIWRKCVSHNLLAATRKLNFWSWLRRERVKENEWADEVGRWMTSENWEHLKMAEICFCRKSEESQLLWVWNFSFDGLSNEPTDAIINVISLCYRKCLSKFKDKVCCRGEQKQAHMKTHHFCTRSHVCCPLFPALIWREDLKSLHKTQGEWNKEKKFDERPCTRRNCHAQKK